jgi:hypothetical protein
MKVAALCDPEFASTNQILEFVFVSSAKVDYHLESIELHILKALLDLLVLAFLARLIIVSLLGFFENDVKVGQIKAAGGLAERS